jgi:alkylation response protein AidB-like acyl-CoA dehydrogenase
MTTETLEIRQLARQFAQSDLRPHVERWDHDGALPADTIVQLEELGFLGMLAAEADGGMGFDLVTYVVALEEIAWGEPGVALLVAVANVHARTQRIALASDQHGSMYAVPAGPSGERLTTMGLRTLELVRAPEGTSATTSPEGLLGVAAIAIGIAQAALEHATSYADIREQFGRKLHEFEGIQYKLADMATRTAAARALLHSVALEPRLETAAMAKVFASEAAMWVTTQAVQIFGGYGYMRDYPVEKLMRDAKATELLEGSNEMLRVTIALDLYNREGN